MAVLAARLTIPDALKPKAAYALRELCHRAGFGLRFVESEGAHIHYTWERERADAKSIVIVCNPRLYRPATICRLHVRGHMRIWGETGTAEELDVIGGAYRLLTLLDEWHVPAEARDRRGTFLTSALPPERRSVVGLPVVEFHADCLSNAVARCWPQLAGAAAPRWPNGKRYALVMSHDTDHVHVGALPELATNLAKAVLRGSRQYAALTRLGIQHISRSGTNPFFRFGWWQNWEAQRGLRSVFYLFVRPVGVPRDLNDCKSTVGGTASDWSLLRRIADDGWEFGLHASIHTREYPHGFRAAREWLEQRLGRRVVGIRHHYFALDWLRPYESHRMHAEAGFKYDSSIAFRDAPGFRTGTSLPHRAFDPVRNEVIPLLVLPCNLMDGHIVYKDVTETRVRREVAARKGSDLAETVCHHGGALMFNWHQESAFNQLIYESFLEVLDDVMTACLQDSAWMATPEEVCAHWNCRSRELDEGRDSPPSFCSSHSSYALTRH